MRSSYTTRNAVLAIALCLAGSLAVAPSAGNSGSVDGTVLDPTAAVVPDATVEGSISELVSKVGVATALPTREELG